MNVNISHKKPKRLLNPASGFLEKYTHTLNPYAGCSFACSYCYVKQMPVALFREEAWGTWVDVKTDAGELLRKELVRAKRKGPVTIFMSSSTDPYQPVEVKERITRSLLTAMRDDQPDFLFVQTRSPLVTRDIDLFAAFGDRIRISMTVETDLEDMRKAFTPAAPPLAGRLAALRELVQAGIPVQATIAPVLPCSDEFAATLAGVVGRVCIDDYAMGDGSGGKRTERNGVRLIYERLGLTDWYERGAYVRVLEQLRAAFPEGSVYVSEAGFLP